MLRDARAAGALSALNGDLMLIHQTAAAFGLWTGRKDDSIVERLTAQLDRAREGEIAAVAD